MKMFSIRRENIYFLSSPKLTHKLPHFQAVNSQVALLQIKAFVNLKPCVRVQCDCDHIGDDLTVIVIAYGP